VFVLDPMQGTESLLFRRVRRKLLCSIFRGEFPKVQWLSPELRFSFGLQDQSRDIIAVCADLLAAKPELLEILLDPVLLLLIFLRRV
jgi:hypothetical protein